VSEANESEDDEMKVNKHSENNDGHLHCDKKELYNKLLPDKSIDLKGEGQQHGYEYQ
jgi:hypothetical protein